MFEHLAYTLTLPQAGPSLSRQAGEGKQCQATGFFFVGGSVKLEVVVAGFAFLSAFGFFASRPLRF